MIRRSINGKFINKPKIILNNHTVLLFSSESSQPISYYIRVLGLKNNYTQ